MKWPGAHAYVVCSGPDTHGAGTQNKLCTGPMCYVTD